MLYGRGEMGESTVRPVLVGHVEGVGEELEDLALNKFAGLFPRCR